MCRFEWTYNNNNHNHNERIYRAFSIWNMLNCAEQVQIQKYKTYAYKTLKTVGVQVIMLKHLTKRKKNTHKTHIPYQHTQK